MVLSYIKFLTEFLVGVVLIKINGNFTICGDFYRDIGRNSKSIKEEYRDRSKKIIAYLTLKKDLLVAIYQNIEKGRKRNYESECL